MEIASKSNFPPVIIDDEGKRCDHVLEITNASGRIFYVAAFGGTRELIDASPMTKEEARATGEEMTKPVMGGFPGYPPSNCNTLTGFRVIEIPEA